MASFMHKVMGQLSYASLSKSDRDAFGLLPGFVDCTPDFFRRFPPPTTVEEKMGIYSFFVDLMGWCAAQWERYPEYLLPGRKPVPHGYADRDMAGEGTPDPESRRIVLRHFVPLLIEELQAGRNEKAALYGGLLAHFIQDNCCFGHQLPNSMFYDYFPEDCGRHILYHYMLDDCDPPLRRVRPKLLGTSADEVVFRLGVIGDRNEVNAKRIFFDMMQACRRNDRDAMNALSQDSLQSAVHQVASLWHSALAIALDRIDPEEAEQLRRFDLCDAVGYSVHPGNVGGYGTVLAGRNVVDTKLAPLVIDVGNAPVRVERGFGMTSFNSIKFLLEPGVFGCIEGYVGLSNRYTQEQDADMNVEFFVGLDETYNRVVSTELDYGPSMKKTFSTRLLPGKQAERFQVVLGSAKTLVIGAISWPVCKNGVETCHYPHIVVANPTLSK